MKLTNVGSLAILAGSPLTDALRTIANPAQQEKYTSGAVMDSMMAAKYVGIHMYISITRLGLTTHLL